MPTPFEISMAVYQRRVEERKKSGELYTMRIRKQEPIIHGEELAERDGGPYTILDRRTGEPLSRAFDFLGDAMDEYERLSASAEYGVECVSRNGYPVI